ncbi:MAG: LamG-like jellyroll fold domain-containing protein [Acidobacteriota bacterium]
MLSASQRPLLRFLCWCSAFALIAASPAAAEVDCLYAIDFGGNSSHITTLYDVDPQTGQASNPRSTGMPGAIGLAFGQDGYLYSVTLNSFQQPSALYRIDPATGSATQIGQLGLSGSLLEGDLAFDPNGTLYGVGHQQKFFTVNTSTGAATSLPSIGGFSSDYSNLAFDDSGTLYALDNTFTAGQATNFWQTVNPGSGIISSSQSLSYFAGPLGGLDYDSDAGEFLMIDSKFPGTSAPGTNSLYRVDLQGNRTLVGSLGVNRGFSGLAACKSQKKPDLVVNNVFFSSSCNIGFEIKNIGAADANGYFSFKSWPLSVPAWGPGPHTGWSAGINGLPAGQSQMQVWNSIDVYGPQLNVEVDPSGSIAESDEGNNLTTVDVPDQCQYRTTSCTPPPPNMTGWYPFDESGGVVALDIRGLHFGTKVNGPTPTTGKVASALLFDGVDDYVEVAHTNSYNIDGPGATDAFSIDAWIRTSGEGGTIASKRVASSWPSHSLGWSFFVQNDELWFGMFTDATSPFSLLVPATDVIQPDTWHHVTATVDHASQTLRLYVDGRIVKETVSYPAMVTANTAPLFIGAFRSPSTGQMGGFFEGEIDEVELFNRALEPEEVFLLYAAQSLGKCKWPCPVFRALESGSEGVGSAVDTAQVLYRVRDERLERSSNGRYFASLFQEHRLRMAYLMVRSAELRDATERVLHAFTPGLEAQLDGRGAEAKVSAKMVGQVAEYANLLVETDLDYGGGELAEAVAREVERVEWDALDGVNFDELWFYLDTLPLDR